MNPQPERKINRLAVQVEQLYCAPPGVFPELTYLRIEREAIALCAAGGEATLEGHVILGAIAPIKFDRESFDRNFSIARRLYPNDARTWSNEALFSIYFGLATRTAEIVYRHRAEILGDASIARLIYDTCMWCCMVGTAMELHRYFSTAGIQLPPPVFPCVEMSRLLDRRGVDEKSLVERLNVGAQAAIAAVEGPLRGYRIIGDETTGYAYEMLFDTDTEGVVRAGAAIAGAITESFADDLSDIITFSAGRYVER